MFRCEVWADQDCVSSSAERLPCAQTWHPVSLKLRQGAFSQPCSAAALHPGVTSVFTSLTVVVSLLHNTFFLETAAQNTLIRLFMTICNYMNKGNCSQTQLIYWTYIIYLSQSEDFKLVEFIMRSQLFITISHPFVGTVYFEDTWAF